MNELEFNIHALIVRSKVFFTIEISDRIEQLNILVPGVFEPGRNIMP